MDQSIFLALLAIPLPIGLLFLTEIIKSHSEIEAKLKSFQLWDASSFPLKIECIDNNRKWKRFVRGYYVDLPLSLKGADYVIYELIVLVVCPTICVIIFNDKLKPQTLLGAPCLLMGQLVCILLALFWVYRAKKYKLFRDQLEYIPNRTD